MGYRMPGGWGLGAGGWGLYGLVVTSIDYSHVTRISVSGPGMGGVGIRVHAIAMD